jgi:hypothetical protein
MGNKIENGNTSVLEIMQNLTFGELSQYSIGGLEDGRIAVTNYPRVMAAINRGVGEIQKDLSINEGSVRLALIPGIVTYPINSEHSVVTGTSTTRFVDDSVYAPFEDDILRILAVYDKGGTELPINVSNRSDTVYVPAHNVIQVPAVKEGDILGVVYTRLTRPTVVTTAAEASTAVLPIPDYTLTALYAYVASVMSAGITTGQEIADSQVWTNKYNAAIAQIKLTPSVAPDDYTNTKLTDNGFI